MDLINDNEAFDKAWELAEERRRQKADETFKIKQIVEEHKALFLREFKKKFDAWYVEYLACSEKTPAKLYMGGQGNVCFTHHLLPHMKLLIKEEIEPALRKKGFRVSSKCYTYSQDDFTGRFTYVELTIRNEGGCVVC